jgi:hypothetical protein
VGSKEFEIFSNLCKQNCTSTVFSSTSNRSTVNYIVRNLKKSS